MDQRFTAPIDTMDVPQRTDGAVRSRPPGGSGLPPGMPPLMRGSMVASPWRGFMHGLLDLAGIGAAPAAATASAAAIPTATFAAASSAATQLAPWELAARSRRRLLLAVMLAATVLATTVLALVEPASAHPVLRALQIGLFAVLFAWIAVGCITAVMGFVVLLRGDRHMLSKNSAGNRPLARDARTAVIMPICNEDVSTVFAGLRATCESLAATGADALFDVYILSDSSDPAVRAAEQAAWSELRGTLCTERLFYRWRQRRTRRKAGNVADFCRRWGRQYRYMIVLDADSVMSGDCMVTLVRLMENHPTAGILQTAPQACGHTALHARAQQFAARVTGRLFTAGMQYWQLGEAHYWGHNAIIRVEPFMKHCALAKLPGEGGLSGDILSHDFVEAALMRRAGYHVWLVPDLVGSYEQQPPHILAELQRDRRWCQGNLQNARLIAEPGLHSVHSAMLVTGAFAYLSAPLWLLYVVLGIVLSLTGGDATLMTAGLAGGARLLWASTIAMLMLPRVLGVLVVLLKGEKRFYGGAASLVKSAVLEAALSSLQAPLRMVSHTLFVAAALLGWKLDWKSPPREATDVPWSEATRRFAGAGAAVLLLGAALALLQPALLIWLSPIGLPLLLAIPYTVLTSRIGLGERIRAANLLLIPEESWSPLVLHRAWDYARLPASAAALPSILPPVQSPAPAMAAVAHQQTSCAGVR